MVAALTGFMMRLSSQQLCDYNDQQHDQQNADHSPQRHHSTHHHNLFSAYFVLQKERRIKKIEKTA